MKVPILVLAFNRADQVAEVMKAIREYKPDRLYLECDGHRQHKVGEKEAVGLTRKTMLKAVDWPCDVKTLFREENLGCAKAVYGAISWFFEQEEYGIICEDDIVLGQDYFKLCEELLPRYAYEEKIMSISSQNLSHRKDIDNTYVYSFRPSCWGWASWARAWRKMDMSMSAVPSLTYGFIMKKLSFIEGVMLMRTYRNGYKHLDSFSSWAYRWDLSILVNNGLVIVPGANLSINIGMKGGAHYENDDLNPYEDLKIGHVDWPIKYNDTFIIDKAQNRYDRKDFWRLRLIGLKKKIRRLLHINKK